MYGSVRHVYVALNNKTARVSSNASAKGCVNSLVAKGELSGSGASLAISNWYIGFGFLELSDGFLWFPEASCGLPGVS